MILSYNKPNIVQIEEKTMTILQRQFINDIKGIPIGVILPLEEYRWIEPILKQRTQVSVMLTNSNKWNKPLMILVL
jgi:hypothetical protein